MARIKITNEHTGEVREVEELVLTSHLGRKGWSKIVKFEPEQDLAPDGTEFIPFEGSEAEAKVIAYKERTDEKEKEEVQVEKPKRGRKPKTDK